MSCEIKNLYANWSIYLAEEWHVLYVFHGKLVSIKITNATLLWFIQIVRVFNVFSSWPPSLRWRIAQFSRPAIPETCPTLLKILLIFTECVKYINRTVIVIITRRWWTLWMTMQVTTCWRRTLRVRPSGVILHFRYSILWCRSWFRWNMIKNLITASWNFWKYT